MRVFWIVVGFHFLFLILLGVQKKVVYDKPSKIQVHTVQLQKPTKTIQVETPIAHSNPTPVAQEAPKDSAEEIAKPVAKEVPKQVAKEISKPVAKEAPKHVAKAIPQKNTPGKDKLKQMLEESLASLETKSTTHYEAPQALGSLKSEALTFVSYETLLIEYLEQLLELPEQGEVKLKLTLTREGKVVSCDIVDASIANRHYIEQEIASLRLPAFESHFKGEMSHTFPIVLKTY